MKNQGPITVIMGHCIEQGETLFKGSTREKDWLLYHDRLTTVMKILT
jgi:hypothetical protein